MRYHFPMMLQTGPTKRKPATMTNARRLRRKQTVTEMLLWRRLRNHRLHGCKFRRQVPIGPFIVDFYHAETKIVVELDGDAHDNDGAKTYDRERQEYLETHGYRVMRFTNDEVNDDIESVLGAISQQTLSPSPSPFAKGEGGSERLP
jgi:very-short-patch-repair endonuclease